MGELEVRTSGFDYIITKDGRKIKSPKIRIIQLTLPEKRVARVDLYPELQTLVSNGKIALPKIYSRHPNLKRLKRMVSISTFESISTKKRR